MRTLAALLKEGTGILEASGIKEAGLDAWLLLEYKTGRNRAYYFAHMEEEVSPKTADAYRDLVRRRAEHIPLQHLTHQAYFMGYEFYVDENVLVPRQDTETLVEHALEALRDIEKPHILDMCTGSGCILLSLLLKKPGSTGVGADISPKALSVAKRNARSLGVEEQAVFVESDTFSAAHFREKGGKLAQEYDILVSNPPYIPTAEIEELMEEVRLHDPRLALDGSGDGLKFYRAITGEAGRYLKPGGWLMYEIGCEQGPAVAQMLNIAGFLQVQIKQDLSGLNRVVMGRKPLE
jgi:release factor glutamine methyltransferase